MQAQSNLYYMKSAHLPNSTKTSFKKRTTNSNNLKTTQNGKYPFQNQLSGPTLNVPCNYQLVKKSTCNMENSNQPTYNRNYPNIASPPFYSAYYPNTPKVNFRDNTEKFGKNNGGNEYEKASNTLYGFKIVQNGNIIHDKTLSKGKNGSTSQILYQRNKFAGSIFYNSPNDINISIPDFV